MTEALNKHWITLLTLWWFKTQQIYTVSLQELAGWEVLASSHCGDEKESEITIKETFLRCKKKL